MYYESANPCNCYTYAKRVHSDCIESIMLVKEPLSSMYNYSLPRCINVTINVS